MEKRAYIKPPLTVQEQINLLKRRGLQIDDEPRATRYLKNISYYRLSGYMYTFQKDKKTHTYKEGTTFDAILNLYRFDRELRLLVFSAIEKIEVAMRSHIAYNFSVTLNDPFWYTKAENFTGADKYGDFLADLKKYVEKSKDVFIKHFFESYKEPWPPIWFISEILTLGQLSKLYDITAKILPRKDIAEYFGIKEIVLVSWLHTLAYVRNICAHHARLWNKTLRIPVRIPKKVDKKWAASQHIANNKMYIIMGILTYLLDTITSNHKFRRKVKNLMIKYPEIDISAMGFPTNWEADPFWN
jgi:abortive infection bacteriophage resistance protein